MTHTIFMYMAWVALLVICVLSVEKSIWTTLQETYHKKVLCQSSDDTYDIYSGKEYRRHSFLMRPYNISLTLNTDGLAIFKSSKNSLWPVWLVINELPPTARYDGHVLCCSGGNVYLPLLGTLPLLNQIPQPECSATLSQIFEKESLLHFGSVKTSQPFLLY